MGPRKHPHNAFFLHALSSICGSRNSLWPPTFCECKFHGLLRVSPIFSLKKWNVQPEVQLLVWKPDLRYDLLVLCPKLGQVWGRAWEPIEVIWLLQRARYQLKFLEASVRKPPAPGLSLLAWPYRNLPLYLGLADFSACVGATSLLKLERAHTSPAECRFWFSRSGVWAKRPSAFLRGFLIMLMLLVHGLHFELPGPRLVVLNMSHQYQQLQHQLGTCEK